MNWDFSQFHFIRPLWLLAIPLAVGLWFLIKQLYQNTHWESHINYKMLQAMRIGASSSSHSWRWLLLLFWIITSFASAGPTWQKQPIPIIQNQQAMVIVFDLSASMLAQDLKPDRLTQAKYKLIDMLRSREDGQTGLIAYAGDAYTVSPLTDDPNAIEVLLPALHPTIMPIAGSNTEAALELASQLLDDSGATTGKIILITDGVTETAQRSVLEQLNSNHQLSVLGVGSEEPTPIPVAGGGFLRGANNQIVLSAPNNRQLNQLAQSAGGRFSSMRLDNSDIEYLIDNDFTGNKDQTDTYESSSSYDNWIDMGHWFVLLLLPIAALCFRKGVLYILPIFLFTPFDSNAFEWQDLWKTPDQQAEELLSENPQAAAEKFERQDWAGVANYEADNYETAAQQFANDDDAVSNYNRGNALSMAGDLEGAIKAYDRALEIDPDFADARHNKEIVEQLNKQQQEQQEQQQQQEGNEGDEDNQAGKEDQKAEDSSENDGSQQQESEQSQGETADSEQGQREQQESDEQTNEESNEEQANSEQDNESDLAEEAAQEEAEATEEGEELSAEQQAEYALEETPDQLKDTSEQWLRTINDDPSGLLRRKFQYQSRQRSQNQSGANTGNNSGEERY